MSVNVQKTRHLEGEGSLMKLNEEKEEINEEEFIEVDVEDFENDEVSEKKVDPEAELLEAVKIEIEKLVEKNKIEKIIKKYFSLLKEIDQSNQLKEEYLKTAQVVQAEFENYKKRVHKDKEWSNFQNKQKVIQKFLTIYDDIERTQDMFTNHPDVGQVKDAVNLIFGNLKSAFESLDIEIIDPQEEIFNPQFHEAVYAIEKEGSKKNQIIEVLSKGFKIESTVIRPARVVIAKIPENKETEE
ncbi:MAG: nucleotide exchange factor GrpE [Candidatus Heimdallarchaeota archaeon]|nr:nucleotide exchange factor GrpE [Candidatus Heimdallarchaeota archaeon]MCK4878363.1 nucleotide exchange factor GrpE [Candidatus Heimdallarchaeota archaeon]